MYYTRCNTSVSTWCKYKVKKNERKKTEIVLTDCVAVLI